MHCVHKKKKHENTNLLASDARANAGPVHNVLEDGGEGGHTDTPSNKDGHLVLIPILVALSVRTVKEELPVGK